MKGPDSFLGIVVRNEYEDVIEAHSFKVSSHDPMFAELLAIRATIMLSLKNDWMKIVCETDAKNIIECLNGGTIRWFIERWNRSSKIF